MKSLLNPTFKDLDKIHAFYYPLTYEKYDCSDGDKTNEESREDNLNDIYQNKTFKFHVIGAGGTGGYVIRDLSRFIYAVKTRIEDFKYEFHIWDGDTVEEKNLLRQNFLPYELGVSKAEAMALRHSSAFGLNIIAHNKFLEKEEIRNYLCADNHNVTIILGCVDNNETRRNIAKGIDDMFKWNSYYKTFFWIDAGNKKRYGQVILGNSGKENKGIPNVTDLYPEILDPEKDSKEKVSCAEALMEDEQNLFVNLTAAIHVLNFIRKIVLNEPLNVHGVEFSIDGKTEIRALTKE